MDATILREARRRIDRSFAHCQAGDNARYYLDRALDMMNAIARHAEGVTHPEWYGGIYTKEIAA